MTLAVASDARTAPARRAGLLDLLLPDDPARRRRLYITIAILFYGLAWALAATQAIVKHRYVDFFQADARGFYAYLPAMIINGNLDFTVAGSMRSGPVVGRGILDDTNDRGYVQNQWPPGVAMTLLPAFLLAHAITWALFHITGSASFTPDGFTILYQGICLAWVVTLITASMILIDRLLQRRWQVPGRAITAAVLACWVGTHYAWYVFREPFMAHVIASAWIIVVVCLFDLILRSLDNRRLVAWHWAAIALCTSLAISCRLTNVVLFPFFAVLLWRVWRSGLTLPFLRLVPLILIACAPLIAHALITRQVTGQVAPTDVHSLGYRAHEGFHWTDPALVQSLFSSRHGLFSWTPILLLSAWGLLRCILRERGWRDPLIACFTLSALTLWYINSAWYAWWFGWAFGNRGFLDLAGLFIIGFALCFRQWPTLGTRGRAVIVAIVILGVTVNYALVLAKLTNAIPEEDYPLQWEKSLSQGAWKRF